MNHCVNAADLRTDLLQAAQAARQATTGGLEPDRLGLTATAILRPRQGVKGHECLDCGVLWSAQAGRTCWFCGSGRQRSIHLPRGYYRGSFRGRR